MSISRMSRGSAWRPSCFIRDTNGQALAYAYFEDDPEDLREVIAAYQKCVAEPVELIASMGH
jgi:hypothetical protein